MLIYGITGGIGSGKSTVSGLLKERGFLVFDADTIGRELMQPGSPLTAKIIERFPSAVVSDGVLDRRRLGELVFADSQARETLEGLVHPAVWRELFARIVAVRPQPKLCFLEAALLVDCELPFQLAGLLLVTAPEAMRIQRVCKRDGISHEQALMRVRAQSSDEHKMLRATHIIDNGSERAETIRQVDEWLSGLNQR